MQELQQDHLECHVNTRFWIILGGHNKTFVCTKIAARFGYSIETFRIRL